MLHVCEFLDWDTRFFGFRIGRIVGHRLDARTARQALSWCRRERIDCLYFLADAHDPETVTAAEAHGFGMKDVRLTYTRRLEPEMKSARLDLPGGVAIRPSRPDDSPILEAIAQDSYTDSRFYFDSRFPRHLAAGMYQTWIRQSVEGQADMVLVLESEDQPAGFITCHLLGNGEGQCRLGGLDARLRGRGLGQFLYDAALRWFARQGVETVIYVTQGRNLRAQRLFQRLGFLSQAIQIWYHRWLDETAPRTASVGLTSGNIRNASPSG